MLKNKRIAVIGLGYVGLPLLVELSKKYSVKGFDLSKNRISQLKKLKDITNEVSSKDLRDLKACLTHDQKKIEEENVYIVNWVWKCQHLHT